jgi:hypothetical protein
MRQSSHRASFTFFVLAIALFLTPLHPVIETGAQEQESQATEARDLRNLLEPGYVLQDRNDDDVIDFVNARIILPADPDESEVAAAANIAARLGYETSAINLDLVGFDSDRVRRYDLPVVLIGTRNALGPGASGSPASDLAPGQGRILWIAADSRFGQGAVWVTGRDATGLMTAADYLSARYPALWAPDGEEISDVGEGLVGILEEREIPLAQLVLGSLVVRADRPGVDRLHAELHMTDQSAFERARAALDSSDLGFDGLRRIEVRLQGPQGSDLIRIRPEKPWQAPESRARAAGSSPDFTLSDLFTIRGLYRDSNRDFVPDQSSTFISLGGAGAAESVVNLAARIGLETAGIRLPLVSVDNRDDGLEQAGFPVALGEDHYQIEQLREDGELHVASGATGEGFIQFLPEAFNEKSGLAVGGTDANGIAAAADYLATRMPYLWEYGKGRYQLRDVETDVRRFFQAREAPGQITLGIHKLRTWLERLGEKDIEALEIELATKERPEGLDRYLWRLAENLFPRADITASTFKTGFGVGKPIFEQEFEIPWEVEAFWPAFEAKVVPRVRAGSAGRIELRVSESPEVRARLVDRIRGELERFGIGADGFDVVVLSAYKQGYSWLYDEILPKIRDRDVGRIEITYHTLKDSEEIRWQTINADTRWLQELYPIDAVLGRELGIPDSLITFSATQTSDPIYAVRVLDRSGSEILTDVFSPRYVVRPYFDLFPEYEQVRVTTGWMMVEANGFTLLNERIKTDPEAFWEILQTETYRKIVDYVMDVQEGRPSSGNAPYFDEFRVELTLSEPNYRIGIDEEVISSVEALHEDIYFETLTLFNLIGGRYGAGSLDYAGRVLPFIKRPVDGVPGTARITFTGKERAAPELILTYTERGREPVRQRYALSNLAVDAPPLRGIAVRAGEEGVTRLLFEVTATDSTERYEEFKERSSEAAIDRSFLSVQKLGDMVEILGELHEARILEEALSYDRLAELRFRFTLEDSSAFTRLATLPRSRNPKSTARPIPLDPEYQYRGERIVQWETPIGLAENEAILSKLNTFPGVNAYYMASSFLGNDIYALDILPPHEAGYISQAKLNALKPTLFLSGRQHANEVSSTSHVLRLAELLATDPSYREYLKHVSVVLHPITNADGTALDVELIAENPDFMVHAAYLGALGVDAGSQGSSLDPTYPEARVRTDIREAWLPDIYLNLHGYPSHEWVQYFAGYSAWVRNRRGGQRSWWSPRGWFIPGFNWIEDDEYPEIKQAQFAILDSIAVAITSDPEVDAANRRMYARYQKYGRQDRENFREYFHNGILVSMALRGREVSGSGVTNPRITYFSITTEAPDETARGDWLRIVCTAGLAHTTAVLRYLNDGENRIERESEESGRYVTRSVSRKRPVLPPEE